MCSLFSLHSWSFWHIMPSMNISIHLSLTVFILLDLAQIPATIINCAPTRIWNQALPVLSLVCHQLSYEPLTLLQIPIFCSISFLCSAIRLFNLIKSQTCWINSWIDHFAKLLCNSTMDFSIFLWSWAVV